MKRYKLQKLIHINKNDKLEVWKDTGIETNQLDALMIFLVDGYRVFDQRINGVIEIRNK